MKKILTLTLLILLTYAANTQAQSEQIPFNITYVVSVPHLTPGDRNVGLEFTVQNNIDAPVDNVKIYLFLRYPFSASISPNNKLGEISYPGYLIASGGSGNEYTQYFNLAAGTAHKTFFKIDVDRNATYGQYDIPYTIYYGQNKESTGKITLAVKGNTLVEVRSVQVIANSSQVEPGEPFKMAVSLENIGDNEIKWLKLTLNPRDKELVPLSSDSERIFKDLSQGTEKNAEFSFSMEKDAVIKNYPVDLVLDYMDERGIEYNETKLVGIVAAGRANLDIAKKTTEPARIKENEPFTLTVKIENTGTGDAKGVTARLESGLEGDTLAYLGEIKKDDYSNAIFTLDGAGSGKKSAVLNISFEDDFGKREMQRELILIVNPADSKNPLPVIIGLIAILAVLYFWKRRKH
jgi:LPXTG-motif cell wall-anchored protein